MWNAIASVSSGITLIAFLAALLVAAYQRRLVQRERLVKLASEKDRGPLIDSVLDRVSIDKGLTREQRYDLAIRLIENRSRRFMAIAVGIGICAVLASIAAWFTFQGRQEVARERATTAFPSPLPFQTGWIFLGYHDSWHWVEGPMARIITASAEGRKPFSQEAGEDALRSVRRMFPDLEQPYDTRRSRGLENLIRYKQSLADATDNMSSIPVVGDILRISKNRRVIIANFKKEGLQQQMTFPGSVKGVGDDDDETGVKLEPGSLVIVRDVKMGAFPYIDSAAVWSRVAACESGIPQCEQALQAAHQSQEPLQ